MKIYLILTHHHSDHSFGMSVFKEKGATIIAHCDSVNFLKEDNGEYKDFIVNRFFKNPTIGNSILGNVKLSTPDKLIDKDTTMLIDETAIEIIVTKGHSNSDTCVYHKDSQTLFAGDTIYEGMAPTTRFGEMSDWKEWVVGLNRLNKIEIKTICPGHGRLCGKNEILKNKRYLEDMIKS